jgi:hypothetical protein
MRKTHNRNSGDVMELNLIEEVIQFLVISELASLCGSTDFQKFEFFRSKNSKIFNGFQKFKFIGI